MSVCREQHDLIVVKPLRVEELTSIVNKGPKKVKSEKIHNEFIFGTIS